MEENRGHFGKKLQARFYEASNGRLPVQEWLRQLGRDSSRVIGADVLKVEKGWPIGLPVCRPLGRGLWEVRSDLPNATIARVLFCIFAGDMVLLHGFIKKTQKTPAHDINLALKRLKSLG